MLNSVSYFFVFIEGVLSFFSPCVIPLVPIYMSYLAGTHKDITENDLTRYSAKKVLIHTIFFVLGISSAFFILGLPFTALGSFFQVHQALFTRVGGLVIIILGLFQIGFLDFKILKRQRKFNLHINITKVNPFVAFIMGFFFSFAWTPCVGPMLSSVLILASSANSVYIGNILVLLYTLGFVIPFLLLGLFTTKVLNLINKHKHILKYIVKIGGILLIIIGIMMFTGWMNTFSSYLNIFDPSTTDPQEDEIKITEDDTPLEGNQEEESTSAMPAIDFTLVDQNGNTHVLSDYKGKVVFLNFWATWCPPCKQEMPHIEEIYNEYNQNSDDVIILGVANPNGDKEVAKPEIITFLNDNKYHFPVVFDETGKLFNDYQISALPTTFMIDKEGNFAGYVPGMLSKDMMKNIIEQTLKNQK